MTFSPPRGHYGPSYIGAEPPGPSERSITPWILGGFGVIAAGLALLGGLRAAQRPRLTAHEKEVLAWEAEFPGLPWSMDQVKDSRQLALWERARDYWEKTH